MGWMSSRLDKVSPLPQSTKLSGVSCGRIFFEFGVGLIWQKVKLPGDILKSRPNHVFAIFH